MALPVILIDSATGSDSAASGAGPGTALTNTGASTNVAGTVVTLNAGTVLTGVSTTGSDVIYLNDTTAGHRRFAKITGTAGSGGATPTVTVAEAFTGSLSGRTWAIGGKRASLGSSSSVVLTDNNNSDGDAMPGWVIEFQTGHTETFAASHNFYRSGTTTGMITVRGATGTPPVLTFSSDGNGFIVRGNYYTFSNLDGRNTNGSKTTSTFIVATNGQTNFVAKGLKVAHSTDKFYRPLQFNGPISVMVVGCELGYAADCNIFIDNNIVMGPFIITDCYIHHATSHGVHQSSVAADGFILHGNIIAANGGRGILDVNDSFSLVGGSSMFIGNTIDGNTSHGIEVAPSTQPVTMQQFKNNIFSNNGGYGLNFSSATAALLDALGTSILNNCFYLNTSGKYNPSDLASQNEVTADPSYTDKANHDYSVGASMASLGYPTGGSLKVGGTSNTYTYIDLGAAQRAPGGGGDGYLLVAN